MNCNIEKLSGDFTLITQVSFERAFVFHIWLRVLEHFKGKQKRLVNVSLQFFSCIKTYEDYLEFLEFMLDL